MNLKRSKKALAGLAVVCALAAGSSATLSASGTTPVPPADCEGDACAAVAVTYDEAKQQYRAQNNSPDRWVRVVAANVASAADACVGPGRAGYLPLKSIVGPYRADYAAVRCGAPE